LGIDLPGLIQRITLLDSPLSEIQELQTDNWISVTNHLLLNRGKFKQFLTIGLYRVVETSHVGF